MKEHNLGDQVFKDTRIKGDDGKERKIIDIAENTWAAPELKLNSDNLAPESRKDVGRASDIGALAGAELPAAQSRQAKLEEASHRIKELNNYLHQPGKPLAGSELELVGFDNKGRLLLIQRDVGKVVSKVLVDSETGKIVARTKPDDLNHWEKSTDYNKPSKGEKPVKDNLDAKLPKDWTSEEKDGGTVLKNKAGLVMAVNDRFGDSRQFKRDNAGTLTEVTINTGASSEVFRRGPSTGGVENELWYQMPYKPEEKPKGFKIEIDGEGNLSKASSPKERRIYRADGSIIDEGPEGRKVVRKVESLVLPGNDTRLA
ncbi:MAG: hypothetical protein K2Y32_11290 [Candidatus Obscuribacterales bacterium]|nr:hypothetical protein [Candidatus Obscuribacterales bacterium]